MNLTIKELMTMIVEENGTFADFTFKEQVSDTVMAFVSIALFETADKMKKVFNEAIKELEIDVMENFESTVSGSEDE